MYAKFETEGKKIRIEKLSLTVGDVFVEIEDGGHEKYYEFINNSPETATDIVDSVLYMAEWTLGEMGLPTKHIRNGLGTEAFDFGGIYIDGNCCLPKDKTDKLLALIEDAIVRGDKLFDFTKVRLQ